MLQPLNNYVVLKKEVQEKTTASGILLTDTSKQQPSIACVVSVGSKCEIQIKENDKVVYKEYSGTNIKLEDIEYILVEEADILAIVK